jgi:hypothetical protein
MHWTCLTPTRRLTAIVLYLFAFLAGWTPLARSFEVERLEIPAIPDIVLSGKQTAVTLDLKPIRSRLNEILNNNGKEVIYFYVRDGRCPLKSTPSWDVYFSEKPDIQTVKTNPAPVATCKINPHYIGNLKFFRPGAWSKKTTHIAFALNRDVLHAICEKEAAAFLTFVLVSGCDPAQLQKTPVTLTSLGFEVQR